MGSRKLDLSQLCWTGGLGFAWILSISLLLYRMTVKKKKKKKKSQRKKPKQKTGWTSASKDEYFSRGSEPDTRGVWEVSQGSWELSPVLYPDHGIPPNTTGAADWCKNSEELYYKLKQGLSSHNGGGAPSESGKSFFILYSRGSGKGSLRGLVNSYCAAGEAGKEA